MTVILSSRIVGMFGLRLTVGKTGVLALQRSAPDSRRSQSARDMVTDLYKYSIQMPYLLFTANHYLVATDKVPSIYGGKFRSIFSDNLQPIATRGKKASGTLLVDKHYRSAGPVLPLWTR